MPTLHAAFYDRPAADRAINDLIAAGISPDDISFAMSSDTKAKLLPTLDANIATGGVGGAAVLGGLAALGGTLLIAATGGLATPFVVGGALGGALAGGVSGLAVGTLVGGLCGAGVAESDAKTLETHVGNGAVVVVVKATAENAPDVDEILRKDDRGAEPTTT